MQDNNPPDDLYRVISELQGLTPADNPDPVPPPSSQLLPVSAEIAKEAARKKDEEEFLRNLKPGQFVPGKGVFLGVWTPPSLKKTFNVYAAPHDLGLDENGKGKKFILSYDRAIKAVSQMPPVLGFKGAGYKNDKELYESLENGTYRGEWFIPTRELVCGTNLAMKTIQPDNLYDCHNDGSFKDTFTIPKTPVDTDSDDHWYWSCSERPGMASAVYVTDFTDGISIWMRKNAATASTRLVRLELRP